MDIISAKMRIGVTAMRVATIAAAALSAVAAWQTAAPLSAPAVFPFSETYYARAVAATDPLRKIRWAQKAIAVAPRRAENWMLMAYAYQARDVTVSPDVIEAVRQSYAAAPLSPDVHDWRLQFMFSNWASMPAETRMLAIKEARVYATREVGLLFLKKLAPTLTNADARFTANLIIRARESRQEADWVRSQNKSE